MPILKLLTLYEFDVFQVEPPPPPPTEPAKEEGMETEGKQGGSESKTSEEAPQQKQAEMDVD